MGIHDLDEASITVFSIELLVVMMNESVCVMMTGRLTE